MKDYELGFTEGKILTYYYFSIPEYDTVMIRFTPSEENGTHFVTELTYTTAKKISERKFRVNDNYKELVQHTFYYSVEKDRTISLEGETIDHAVIEGDRYNGGEYFFRFQTPDDIVSKIKVLESFEKDTTFFWDEANRPALKFKVATSFRSFYRYLPFINNSEVEYNGYVLFVKGTGLVYYSLSSDSNLHSKSLIRIEGSEKYPAYTKQ